MMEHINRFSLIFIFLTLFLCLAETQTFAYDVAVENADGKTIYYNLAFEEKEATVTHPNERVVIGANLYYYKGAITIPEKIVFEGEEYSVTSIDNYAFHGCSSMSTVSIPNSVSSIGIGAFYGCSGLNTITIPDGVNGIEKHTFVDCTGLTDVIIPNTVTYIGWAAFSNCSGLTSIEIPNNVTSIGESAFSGCSNLTSLTIPSNVTSIGALAFWGCSGLTSVEIPVGVTYVDIETFSECTSLTSVSIPNSVTSISDFAFNGCSELTSVKIPSLVMAIGQKAFAGCSKLDDVYCFAKNVPTTKDNAFDNSNIYSATLHVPVESVSKYKAKSPWNRFKELTALPSFTLTYILDGVVYKTYTMYEDDIITPEPVPTKEGYTFSGWNDLPSSMPAEDLTVTGTFTINKYKLIYMVDGEVYRSYDIKYGSTITPEPAPSKEGYTFSGWSEIPEEMPAYDVTITGTFTPNSIGKCATPTISYTNDKLTFSCLTEGVEFVSEITDDDIKISRTSEVELTKSYTITVYATKKNYEDSDVATATLCWIDVEPRSGVVTDVAQIRANAALIKSNGGQITVTGIDDGTQVNVYDLTGKLVGSGYCSNGIANVSTKLHSGDTAVVKIGNKSVKVMVK